MQIGVYARIYFFILPQKLYDRLQLGKHRSLTASGFNESVYAVFSHLTSIDESPAGGSVAEGRRYFNIAARPRGGHLAIAWR